MKFGGQTSKNVHDVQKVCLEMTLCALACFADSYEFILDEIDVRVPKLLHKHIWVGNFLEKSPKDKPRVLEEGPILVAKTAKSSPTY